MLYWGAITNEEILREATLLRNASTAARELIELLERDIAAGQAAFRSATPETRGLFRRRVDPQFQLTDRTRRLDPHWHASIEKLRQKVRAGHERFLQMTPGARECTFFGGGQEMSITTRSRAEQHALNERRWAEIMADPFVDSSISKIETDREGNVIMSPSAGKDHGDRQAEIAHQLKLFLPMGGVMTECAVSTQEGNKTPDVSWISIHHPQFRQRGDKVLHPSGEICVEVLSPKNSSEEIEAKKRCYFEEGAQEVWVCGLDGKMSFFSPEGELRVSRLCPKFPKRILTSDERLDLELQKQAARRADRPR